MWIYPLDFVPSHEPSLTSSVTKLPARFPDPKKILAFCGVLAKVYELSGIKLLSLCAPPGNSTLSLRTQVFVEPVSNKAFINYGGFPTYISET